MTTPVSQRLTDHSTNFIRQLVAQKNSSYPLTVSNAAIVNVVTDMDSNSVDYGRRFRGQYMSSVPIIFERETGWREVSADGYKLNNPKVKVPEPDIMFSPACTTILPNHADIYSQYQQR